jgi:adenine-specific DNA methylase
MRNKYLYSKPEDTQKLIAEFKKNNTIKVLPPATEEDLVIFNKASASSQKMIEENKKFIDNKVAEKKEKIREYKKNYYKKYAILFPEKYKEHLKKKRQLQSERRKKECVIKKIREYNENPLNKKKHAERMRIYREKKKQQLLEIKNG